MRRRLKLPAHEIEACYHCMTRCVQGRPLLDPASREVLRRMIWRVAEFCGIEVVTYAIMDNHFHVLIRIPIFSPITDQELLRRYQLLHPKPSPYRPARPEVIAGWLENNSAEGIAWRNQQLALMNDVSAFMRLLKQRFSIWFNTHHNTFGTLWAERFKSVLVDHESDALRTMAAYIDLNPVRKGLVNDPKDYRWCGYSDALAGHRHAKRGLAVVCPEKSSSNTLAAYRILLYSVGAAPREKDATLPDHAFAAVMKADGQLSLADHLRHRCRHFTDSVALGSYAFINAQRIRITRASGTNLPPSPSPAQPIPSTPWGNWFYLQRLRKTKHLGDA